MLNSFRKGTSLIMVGLMVVSIGACGTQKDDAKVSQTSVTKSSETSTKSENQVKLKIYSQYSSDSEKLPYDYAVEKMKIEMPNIVLDLEIQAQDDNQKIKTYAASGNLPDIFNATSDLIEVFKVSKNVLPLDTYVADGNIESLLNPSSIGMLKNEDGHIYAVPASGQWAASLFINKEVFTKSGVKIPTNYEELLSAVTALNAKNITPLAIFAKEKWPCVQLFDMLVSREEALGISKVDQGKGDLNEAAYKNAANKLVKLVEAGLVSKDAFNTTADQALELFANGKAAMFINGAWAMDDVVKKLGENVDILYSAPFADAATAESTKWVMSGGGFNQGFAVSAKSENADIAAKYATQLSLKFAEGRVVKLADPNPVLKDSIQPEAGYNTLQQKYASDTAKFTSMTCFPWGLKNAKFKAAMEDNSQKLLTGQYSVDKFISDTNKSLTK